MATPHIKIANEMNHLSDQSYLILWVLIQANGSLSATEIRTQIEILELVEIVNRTSIIRLLTRFSSSGDVMREERNAEKISEPKFFYRITPAGKLKFETRKKRLNHLASIG